MDDYGLGRILRLKITLQTIKDYWRITIILTILYEHVVYLPSITQQHPFLLVVLCS